MCTLRIITRCTSGVTENGEVYIWGQDEGGRLGHENEDEEENPVQWEVKTMLPCDVGVEAGQMAMGSAHTMILTTRYRCVSIEHSSCEY